MMGDATNAARGAGACAAFVALRRREGGLKAATAENKCSDPFEKKRRGTDFSYVTPTWGRIMKAAIFRPRSFRVTVGQWVSTVTCKSRRTSHAKPVGFDRWQSGVRKCYGYDGFFLLLAVYVDCNEIKNDRNKRKNI